MRTRTTPISTIAVTAILLALLAKFFWPLATFGWPLGYDAGIYRYLFTQHATGFPPLWIGDIEPWARSQPLGLFFFSTILVRLGIPVDWLTGWIWNLFPVALACTLAWVTAKREGKEIGMLVLVAAFLSVAYYDGFAAMYWKTYASLLFCVLGFHFLEKRSLWALLFGSIAIMTHHQTGLLFGLSVATWWLIGILRSKKGKERDQWLMMLCCGLCILAIGLVSYLPVWREAIADNLWLLLHPSDAPGGNFPPLSFYLRQEGILLLCGAYGFVRSFRRESGTLWQCAVLWAAAFIALHFLFYRRFFLQLDFFLLPFAALGIYDLWDRARHPILRGILILLLLMQATFAVFVIPMRTPYVDGETFAAAARLQTELPPNATIIVPENISAVVVRGWAPDARVVAPGIFESVWTYDQWKAFILGTNKDRLSLLKSLKSPVMIFVAPAFSAFYGTSGDAFLRDACFQKTDDPFLLRVTCIP
ncbi:hypothetical protein HZA45_01760 [Candidatus Peregrinibacteria bacterium]|nr:hypothetical protein [Candidatus Peregrinibacteria bacterium]